jgi:hypothetical protein
MENDIFIEENDINLLVFKSKTELDTDKLKSMLYEKKGDVKFEYKATIFDEDLYTYKVFYTKKVNSNKKFFYVTTFLLLIASCSLELWGLYSVLNITGDYPYMLISPVIAIFKFIYKSGHKTLANYFLYTLTIFFAILQPINDLRNIEKVGILESQIKRSESRIEVINKQSEINMNAKAVGNLKYLSRLDEENNEKLDKLIEKKVNSNSLFSYIILIMVKMMVIISVEIMLFISLRWVSNER